MYSVVLLKNKSKNKKKVSSKKKVIKQKKKVSTRRKASTGKKKKISAVKKSSARKIINAQEKIWKEHLNLILSDAAARQLLVDLGGENTLQVVRNFCGNLSDEEIAKKLKLKISDVRATLNKLHSVGLVNYVRKKDSETGWYSYSWSINKKKMSEWVKENANGKNKFIENGQEMYFCPSCGEESIIPFNEAAECEFRCQRCEKLLEFLDDVKASELFELKRIPPRL